MLLLDVNVILAVHRDDHPDHETSRSWFNSMLDALSRFTVPATVWGSFLRIATSRKIFEVPTPHAEAFAFIDAVRAQPGHLPIAPGPRHLDLLRDLCDEGDASGDLVPDAVIAAIAAENACEIVTFDRDFARFASVPHQRPG